MSPDFLQSLGGIFVILFVAWTAISNLMANIQESEISKIKEEFHILNNFVDTINDDFESRLKALEAKKERNDGPTRND